jgi:hypothetical protein
MRVISDLPTFWNPSQKKPRPPISKLEESKRAYVLSTLRNIPDCGINAQVITKKGR